MIWVALSEFIQLADNGGIYQKGSEDYNILFDAKTGEMWIVNQDDLIQEKSPIFYNLYFITYNMCPIFEVQNLKCLYRGYGSIDYYKKDQYPYREFNLNRDKKGRKQAELPYEQICIYGFEIQKPTRWDTIDP